MFGVSDHAKPKTTLAEIKQHLSQKVHNESYDSLMEGNDVFRGKIMPGMFLLWYVKAQTAATPMEALTTDKQ
tara:strand:- start:207 stop:422 length:216 start_codon:yes stop_codon:yes gene_type:complete